MDWVDEFALYLAEQIEGRPVPAPAKPIVLPAIDAPDESLPYIGEAEGQFFMIDYRDARGQVSTRRITVRSVERSDQGAILLAAVCHERRAMRQFRVDRITACYEHDGEVKDDVALFLFDALGIPMEATLRAPMETTARQTKAERLPSATKSHVSWNEMRRIVKHHALLFAALSHSDGQMLPEELAIAAGHCRDIARGRGHEATEAEMGALHAYMRRLRPEKDAIDEALALVFRSRDGDPASFLLAAAALIDADGQRHDAETAMLTRISDELRRTGVLN